MTSNDSSGPESGRDPHADETVIRPIPPLPPLPPLGSPAGGTPSDGVGSRSAQDPVAAARDDAASAREDAATAREDATPAGPPNLSKPGSAPAKDAVPDRTTVFSAGSTGPSPTAPGATPTGPAAPSGPPAYPSTPEPYAVSDPYGGLDDLADHGLRTPAPPVVSVSDDPLRRLRAARFAANP